MAPELIPRAARQPYEELIASGGIRLAVDDPRWKDPTVQLLVEAFLVGASHRDVSRLSPTPPAAAFEWLLAHWRGEVEERQRILTDIGRLTIGLQQRFVRSLSTSALSTPCQLIISATHVSPLFDALSAAGEREICNWVTGPYMEPATVGSPPPAQPRIGYVAPEPNLLKRGGQARAVYDQRHADDFAEDLACAYSDGEQVRVTQAALPMKLLIVDDHTALVPLAPYGHPALLIRSRELVAMFRRFFDLVWDTAVPWQPGTKSTEQSQRTDPNDLSTRRRILGLLREGLKDEAIARQLGVSARTVRRNVAEMMRELRAPNRFAAGVAAVRAGWFDSP